MMEAYVKREVLFFRWFDGSGSRRGCLCSLLVRR